MRMNLPQPDQDARAASDALCQLIADEIKTSGGWLCFAKYMASALYAPRLGYYSGGAIKLGREGDFTTSPEISPLFGAALAQPLAAILAQTTPQIMEFGAGSGKLARDILTELTLLGVKVDRYIIVELSGELRARQQAQLQDFPQIEWLDALPTTFSGAVIGNEVLDAMPVNLVKKTAQGWCELGVGLSDEGNVLRDAQTYSILPRNSGSESNIAGDSSTTDPNFPALLQNDTPLSQPYFTFVEQVADAALLAQIADQIPDADVLPEGMVTEVHGQACAFMRSVSAMLAEGETGAAIFIDYGFPAHEYYLPERSQGTLMCHYRHRAHGDPFWLPGLQDITAHVDFSAMATAAEEGGMEVLAYMNQTAFLLAAGIGDLLLRTSPEDTTRYLPQSNAVQKLISPAEMGELFKVLMLGISVDIPEIFLIADRSHRL